MPGQAGCCLRDRILWWPLLVMTLAVVMPAGPRGYGIEGGSPFPATWLLGALATALLGIVFAAAVMRSLLRRHWRQAISYGVAILAYAAFVPPPLSRTDYLQQEHLGNLIRFLTSYPIIAWPMQTQAPGAGGLVLRPWSIVGFGGARFIAYLVFDPIGRSPSAAQRAHPNGDFGLACPIMDVQPMAPSWVILTTYNCVLP